MGLPIMMANVHEPTVLAGPATAAALTNGQTSARSLDELKRKKDDLEAELKALGGVLDSHGVNMDAPLLTRDGFPRADLDVAQIRTTRARIIRLRNDHKALMGTIERLFHEYFANADTADDEPVPSSEIHRDMQSDFQPDNPAKPFAKINTIAPGSPAERAGLKPGYKIRTFGNFDRENHGNLGRLLECVHDNEGRDILIQVSRAISEAQVQELRLTLTPYRNWGSRGMLGCHVLPLRCTSRWMRCYQATKPIHMRWAGRVLWSSMRQDAGNRLQIFLRSSLNDHRHHSSMPT